MKHIPAKGVFRPSSAALNPSAVSAAVGGSFAAPHASGDPAKNGALGNNVKSLDQRERHQGNLSRYASKWTAANLLQGHDDTLAKRLSHCGYVAREFAVTLDRNGSTGAGSFSGLKTCASVWCCPCCSPRISNGRRDELNQLLSGARSEKLAVVMLTLTARHDRSMRLAPFLDALKRAKERLRQRREWRSLKPAFVGSVTATEVTHGRNGFHPHFHEIIVMDCPPADALERIGSLRSAWLASLAGVGLSGNDAAFQVQPAQAVGQYVAKFGAAEELTLQSVKQGRNGSRSPWQLLSDARDGDAQAAAVWIEYALAFRGRRQLVWSPRLKARFNVDEKPDDALAGEAEPSPDIQTLRAWMGSGSDWRNARRRRVALVRAAESGTCLDAAEFGPTDSETWQRLGGEMVIEPPA